MWQGWWRQPWSTALLRIAGSRTIGCDHTSYRDWSTLIIFNELYWHGCTWPNDILKTALWSVPAPVPPSFLLPPLSPPHPPPHMTHRQPEMERLFLIHCYLVHMHNSCLILVAIFRKYCLSLSVK